MSQRKEVEAELERERRLGILEASGECCNLMLPRKHATPIYTTCACCSSKVLLPCWLAVDSPDQCLWLTQIPKLCGVGYHELSGSRTFYGLRANALSENGRHGGRSTSFSCIAASWEGVGHRLRSNNTMHVTGACRGSKYWSHQAWRSYRNRHLSMTARLDGQEEMPIY